jgi:hypothetical protein
MNIDIDVDIEKYPLLKAAAMATALICAFAVTATSAAGGRLEQPKAGFWPTSENAVFVDAAPLAFGLFMGQLLTMAGRDSDSDASAFGFGIGVQYERRLREKFSLAGKFVYQIVGLNLKYNFYEHTSDRLNGSVYAASFEAHARYYPFRKAFFLDGMAGLGSAGISADYKYSDKLHPEDDSREQVTIPGSYFTCGPSLGYRRTFAKDGSLGYETSFGYSLVSFMGNPVTKIKESDRESGERVSYEKGLGWGPFESLLVPRLTAALGYSF